MPPARRSNAPVSVLVENRAARLAQAATASVTGTPSAPASLVLKAAYNAVYRTADLQPNALIELLRAPSTANALPPGASAQIPVTLRAVGSDLLPVETTTTVTVTNDAARMPLTAQTLFYSNSPERIARPQTLFTAHLPPLGSQARLVYHHLNDSDTPLLLRVEIANPSRLGRDCSSDRQRGRADPNPSKSVTARERIFSAVCKRGLG